MNLFLYNREFDLFCPDALPFHIEFCSFFICEMLPLTYFKPYNRSYNDAAFPLQQTRSMMSGTDDWSKAGLGVGKLPVSSHGRPYLADAKPIIEPFKPKSLAVTVVKASVLPVCLALQEYTKFLEEQERNYDPEAEFDWNDCMFRYLDKFIFEAKRMLSVSFIKTFIEHAAIEYLPPKIADKLTKDLQKSVVRKCIKYSSNRFVICKKIIHTAFWSYLPMYSAFAIVDVSVILWEPIQRFFDQVVYKGSSIRKALDIIQYKIVGGKVGKKLLLMLFSNLSMSLGYGIGSLFHCTKGGFWGGNLLELAVSASLSHFFGV
jgi:hypothetical protein